MFADIHRFQSLVCDAIDAAQGKEYANVFCTVARDNTVFGVSSICLSFQIKGSLLKY